MSEFNLDSLIVSPIFLASMNDFDFLVYLEETSFEEYRQSSPSMIKNSLNSKHQMVLIINDDKGCPCGSISVRRYKKQLKIVSLAILESHRGREYGQKLIRKVIEIGKYNDVKTMTLEVDANNKSLILWYETFGFEQMEVLEDYYKPKKHAIRMKLDLKDKSKYIIVTDYDTHFFDNIENAIHIRSTEFIENKIYQKAKDIRIFNFCANYKYQSVGYYVSLLALARNQVAYPSAGLIRDIDNEKVLKSIGEEINELIQNSLKNEEDEVVIDSYFGTPSIVGLEKLVYSMSNLYHAPLMRYYFVKKSEWYLRKIKVLSLKDIPENLRDEIQESAIRYFEDQKFVRGSLKHYEYDMAILVDKQEKLPPSDMKALKCFEKAASALGFYVEYITQKDYARIPEFDALFIRTTTNVNDYTYDFARYAYAEGLVVMDDPWSILRCANKIYLYEALQNAKVKMPKTWVINKKSNFKEQIKKLKFPIILKLPDSAFSEGVFKVNSVSECDEKLKSMFKRSELIIAQEYMPTEYDWRIGILDRKPLFACKYYMAKNHWQIVNWEKDGGSFKEGDYEAVSINEVPKNIIDTAIKAASEIGDGLYGVDLKSVNNEVYVIEVNDNPSLEYHVEDLVEGSELYMRIMMSFYHRLENNMKMLRTIS